MADARAGLTNNNCISHYSANADENYQMSWRLISEKIIYLLKRGPQTPMTFEPLYSQIYRTVCSGKAERMYLDLVSLCSKHLSEVEQALCPPDDVTLEHFMSVSDAARDYIDCVKKISLLFSYLNKNYVSYQLCSDLFTELGVLFNQTILQRRIPALMGVAEEALKVQPAPTPNIMHRFFNDVKTITQREYAVKYPHLFSRYAANVLPHLREYDPAKATPEALEFQERLRERLTPQAKQGRKRPLEDEEEEEDEEGGEAEGGEGEKEEEEEETTATEETTTQ